MHDLCMYLRKLHFTKPSRVGIRLGAGKQRFVVSNYCMQAEEKISGFLKMHSVLDAMPTCSSIQVYQKQKKVFRAMTDCKVCQMSKCGDGYNREFTFSTILGSKLFCFNCFAFDEFYYSAPTAMLWYHAHRTTLFNFCEITLSRSQYRRGCHTTIKMWW